jgi:hypothetical protein
VLPTGERLARADRAAAVAVAVLALLALLLRLTAIGRSLWLDEAWRANTALAPTWPAFWSDVLTAQYAGFTDAFTMVNAAVGVKWADGKYITSLKAVNLLDEDVQQHVFGDILKRSVSAELRMKF